MKAASTKAFLAVLLASVMWAICNVAWRYGEGNTLALAGQRALVGALFFSPVIARASRDGRMIAALRDKLAVGAMLTGGAILPFNATVLRNLTSPQVALISAVTPALLLITGRLLRERNRKSDPTTPSGASSKRSKRSMRSGTFAVLVSVVAACGAAVSGGLGHFAAIGLLAATFAVMLESLNAIFSEHARARHDATVLVSGAMLVGAIGSYTTFAAVHPSAGVATSGLLVATLIGVLATSGRALRTHALPHLGAAVAYSARDVEALLTALGGIVLLGDAIDLVSGILVIAAAAASLVAMTQVVRAERAAMAAPPRLGLGAVGDSGAARKGPDLENSGA